MAVGERSVLFNIISEGISDKGLLRNLSEIRG